MISTSLECLQLPFEGLPFPGSVQDWQSCKRRIFTVVGVTRKQRVWDCWPVHGNSAAETLASISACWWKNVTLATLHHATKLSNKETTVLHLKPLGLQVNINLNSVCQPCLFMSNLHKYWLALPPWVLNREIKQPKGSAIMSTQLAAPSKLLHLQNHKWGHMCGSSHPKMLSNSASSSVCLNLRTNLCNPHLWKTTPLQVWYGKHITNDPTWEPTFAIQDTEWSDHCKYVDGKHITNTFQHRPQHTHTFCCEIVSAHWKIY